MTVEAPQLLLDAVHSLALEVQATGCTPQVARESSAMRSLNGVRETERPLQTVEGWLVSAVSTLLVSSHSGQMSGSYGFVYVVSFLLLCWLGPGAVSWSVFSESGQVPSLSVDCSASLPFNGQCGQRRSCCI